ncbi:MAG: PhzF family phenazine biosynthesis protein [Ignavibacteriae bacterium]|nr:PhzF family phenazine biosynthesis protein [Ignavibacteriota bacterium]
MKIKIYQVDAFAERIFTGNPAAVCVLKDEWPDDSLMQNIAMEKNLSETAFVLNQSGQYHIRWFTPAVEVDLCGHATLASAHVLFSHENFTGEVIKFNSKSGILSVRKEGDFLTLDFPADKIERIEPARDVLQCFDTFPREAYKGKTDLLLVFNREEQISGILYDIREIKKLNTRGVIITAPGNEVDFVSRFFGPRVGIEEDPVTGSAHTTLVPYWNGKTGKDEFTARQLSKRGGFLKCRYKGERIEISGKAKTYLIGEILDTN